jgi:hypothetical protein
MKYNLILRLLLLIYLLILSILYFYDTYYEGYKIELIHYVQIIILLLGFVIIRNIYYFLILTGLYIICSYIGIIHISHYVTLRYFTVNNFSMPLGNFKIHFAAIVYMAIFYNYFKVWIRSVMYKVISVLKDTF